MARQKMYGQTPQPIGHSTHRQSPAPQFVPHFPVQPALQAKPEAQHGLTKPPVLPYPIDYADPLASLYGHSERTEPSKKSSNAIEVTPSLGSSNGLIQRFIRIKDGSLMGEYTTKGGKDTKELITKIENKIGSKMRRGWKAAVGRMAGDDKKHKFEDTKIFLKRLLKIHKIIKTKKKRIRPNFPAEAYDLGRITLGIQSGKDQSSFSPSQNDAALPHRFPYAAIQESTKKYIDRQEKSGDLIRWSDRLKEATKERLEINKKALASDPTAQQNYELKVSLQINFFENARNQLISAVNGGQQLTLTSTVVQNFLKYTNGLHGNIPDYGPHSTVNIPVSDRLHMHFETGSLTPGSKAAGSMTPTRSRGLAMTDDGQSIVTTDGWAFDYTSLNQQDKALLDKQVKNSTSIEKKNLTGSSF